MEVCVWQAKGCEMTPLRLVCHYVGIYLTTRTAFHRSVDAPAFQGSAQHPFAWQRWWSALLAKRYTTNLTKHLLKARLSSVAIVCEAEERAIDIILTANSPTRVYSGKQQLDPVVEYVLKNAPCEVLVLSQGQRTGIAQSVGSVEEHPAEVAWSSTFAERVWGSKIQRCYLADAWIPILFKIDNSALMLIM